MEMSKIQQNQPQILLKSFLPGILVLFSLTLWSQTSNSDFERIKLNNPETEYTGIAMSPDNNTISISSEKSAPVLIFDWNTQKITRQINAGSWNSGARISFSLSGKYLLLQEIAFTNFSQNKDRSIHFDIVDVASGEMIKQFDNVQDVVLSADENQAICLANDEVTFWNLNSAAKENSIKVEGVSNALAVSPDGKQLAVSTEINPSEVKSRFGKDKKGMNDAVKFKQMVAIYDIPLKAKIKTIDELYDIIYELRYLPESEQITVFQTPEIHIQVQNSQRSYINLIDAVKFEPLRKGFTSMSLAQPDMKISNNHELFAINSKGNRFQEMHLYDYDTATLQKRFELAHRLFEKVDGEKMVNSSRPSFIFLPDNQSILVAMGNQLIKWNIKLIP